MPLSAQRLTASHRIHEVAGAGDVQAQIVLNALRHLIGIHLLPLVYVWGFAPVLNALRHLIGIHLSEWPISGGGLGSLCSTPYGIS